MKKVFFKLICLSLLAVFIFLPKLSHAQTIVETFEGSSWATTYAGGNSGTLSVSSAASSVSSQVISTYNGTTAGTVTTNAVTASANGTWGYAQLTTVSSASNAYGAQQIHSATHGILLAENGGYLITPVISSGISTVSFWLSNGNGGTASIYVGYKTNVTGTNSTFYPTAASNNRFTTSLSGGVYVQYPIQSTYFTTSGGYPASATKFVYTITGTNSSAPGQLVFFNDGAYGFDGAQIDDIVITPTVVGPAISLSSIPATCYSVAVQTVHLAYTATSGTPTSYSISGWSNGAFSNVTNAALPSSPINITVPAGIAAGTYTATLTVSSGITASSNYSISVQVLAAPTMTQSTATQTVCQNIGATALSVTASAGSGSISNYQWYSNATTATTGGTAITGATTASYTPSTITAGTTYYYATVTNSNTCASTSAISGAIIVNAAPQITAQPSSLSPTYYLNGSATPLSVTAAISTGTITGYQWYSNTRAVPTGGTAISGATTATYTPSTAVQGVLYYYVIVAGNTCSTTSAVSGAVTTSGLTAVSGWGLTGNTGLTTANFIGTTDNTGFQIFTNNLLRVLVDGSGNVVIGGTHVPTGYSFAVNGVALFNKIQLKAYANWPDYVFDSSYHLLSLKDLAKYVEQNKHLPDVVSATDAKNNGFDMGDNQAVLLKKIEELTLYIIDQDKKVQTEDQQLQSQDQQLKQLQQEINQLKQSINKK